VSGAVAERCTLAAYFTYSVCLTAFIYPVVVHWGWSPDGWASAWREKDLLIGCGAVDFAGSGVVHMTGGVAAVIGAKMLGARKDPNPDLPAQSYVFQTLGVLILWTGWYGFNGVSTVAINGLGQVAAKAMVTTTISAGTGAIATVFTTALYEKKENGGIVIKLSSANNGVLAGLVSITAGCSTVDPYGAFIIGLLAAPVYVFASKLLKRLGIDDVVDAFPIHGVCGFYGVFMTGLFATKNNFASAYYADRAEKCAGVFYGGDGSMLAANITMLLAIIAWTGTCSTFVFGILYKLNLLRVSEEVEDEGMDISEHGIKPTKAAPPTDGKQQLEVASTEI
jgi:Amt family ammonium transporter